MDFNRETCGCGNGYYNSWGKGMCFECWIFEQDYLYPTGHGEKYRILIN